MPVRDGRRLFEMLCLEGAQAGLSWLTILRKREAYRRAFDGFDPAIMARYGSAKRRLLLEDAGIVRNRLKIEAFIGNARAYLEFNERHGSFAQHLWEFTGGEELQRRPARLSGIATTSRHSEAMSRDLKRRGFRFVGPTICHAFMQAVGMIDEHQRGCWVTAAARYRSPPRARMRAVSQGGS